MKVLVVNERKEPLGEPYVVRLGGWSLERYIQEAPEHLIWEFVRGDVLVYSPATGEHQDLVRFLLVLLNGYCEAKNWGKALAGPAAVRLLPDVIREPDIFVLSPEDIPKAKGMPLEIKPVLVIEVASPSTRSLDLGEKAEDYALAGVPEYWVVDREKKEVVVHQLSKGKYRAHRVILGQVKSSAVPGFWLDTGWLFEEPLPSATSCLEKVLKI